MKKFIMSLILWIGVSAIEARAQGNFNALRLAYDQIYSVQRGVDAKNNNTTSTFTQVIKGRISAGKYSSTDGGTWTNYSSGATVDFGYWKGSGLSTVEQGYQNLCQVYALQMLNKPNTFKLILKFGYNGPLATDHPSLYNVGFFVNSTVNSPRTAIDYFNFNCELCSVTDPSCGTL